MFDSGLNTLAECNKYETFVIKLNKFQEIRNYIPLVCNTVFRIMNIKVLEAEKIAQGNFPLYKFNERKYLVFSERVLTNSKCRNFVVDL